MAAARPFRWLLALVTLIMPASMVAGRAAAVGSDVAPAQDPKGQVRQSQVVFRHYI